MKPSRHPSVRLPGCGSLPAGFGPGLRRCFTLIELLMVMAIISILASLLLPSMSRAKAQAKRIQCVNNQKQLALGFSMWADDNEQKFPWQVRASAGGTWGVSQPWQDFYAIRTEMSTPRLLVCPSGDKRAAQDFSTNADTGFAAMRDSAFSYFIGVEASSFKPMMHLLGDDNIFSDAPVYNCAEVGGVCVTRLRPDDTDKPHWDWQRHVRVGNIALADGSVHRFSQGGLSRHLASTGSPNLDNCILKAGEG